MDTRDRLIELLENQRITSGEARVLELLLTGMSRKEVAKRLYVQPGAIHKAVRLLRKKGVLARGSKEMKLVEDEHYV